MKKLWYVVIVLAIVYLGWEFFRPRAGEMQSVTSTASVIDTMGGGSGAPQIQSAGESLPAAVTYSATGFTPASIAVKKGTAVMWTNLSWEGMWITADPETAYDGTARAAHCAEGAPASFDQCMASAAGSQWSFTFNKVGTWKYSNGVNKAFGGTVTVTE